MSHSIAVLAMLGSTIIGVTVPVGHAAASAGPSVRACYDGSCRLTLTKRVSFPVHPRFGITRVSITFDQHAVRVRGTAPGASSQAVVGIGASGSVNDIGIRVKSLSGGKAVLRLTRLR